MKDVEFYLEPLWQTSLRDLPVPRLSVSAKDTLSIKLDNTADTNGEVKTLQIDELSTLPQVLRGRDLWIVLDLTVSKKVPGSNGRSDSNKITTSRSTSGTTVIVGMGSIGSALAVALVAAGCNKVVFFGRRPDSNQEASQHLLFSHFSVLN